MPKFDDDSSYDPAEFNVPACDSKGHSIPIHIRIQSSMKRSIQGILSAQPRLFPYLDQSDLIRHAIKRHLEWLNQLEDVPDSRSWLSICQSSINRMRAEQEEKDTYERGELFRRQIEGLLGNGPDGRREARRRVALEIGHTKTAPKSFYRNMYLKQLDQTFGYLLEDGPKKDEEDQ